MESQSQRGRGKRFKTRTRIKSHLTWTIFPICATNFHESSSFNMLNNTTALFVDPYANSWLKWRVVTNPLLIILHVSSAMTNLLLFTTMLKDPLKCFRSISSFLLRNLILNGFLPMATYCLYVITLAADTVHLGVWALVSGFNNTIIAVLLLSVDRYILVSRPMMYAVILTKSRVTYTLVLSWLLTLAMGCGIALYQNTLFSNILVFSFIPLLIILVAVIIVVDFKTWTSVKRAQLDLQRLGNQSGLDERSASYRSELKRVQTEKRFAKVVVLLLFNVLLFMLPQAVAVGFRLVDFWCDSCMKFFRRGKTTLFQVHIFPLFYLTTPILYLAFIPKYRKSFAVMVSCFKVYRRWSVPR